MNSVEHRERRGAGVLTAGTRAHAALLRPPPIDPLPPSPSRPPPSLRPLPASHPSVTSATFSPSRPVPKAEGGMPRLPSRWPQFFPTLAHLRSAAADFSKSAGWIICVLMMSRVLPRVALPPFVVALTCVSPCRSFVNTSTLDAALAYLLYNCRCGFLPLICLSAHHLGPSTSAAESLCLQQAGCVEWLGGVGARAGQVVLHDSLLPAAPATQLR